MCYVAAGRVKYPLCVFRVAGCVNSQMGVLSLHCVCLEWLGVLSLHCVCLEWLGVISRR